MVRLIEHKKIIAGCIILILIVFTIVIIMLPQRTTEIKNNIVYMSGYYTEYPDKDDPRYYIEFKNDGTYVLMYDDSRRNEENYDEDGDGSRPIIDMYFGKYKIKNGNFLIKPSEEAGVGFKDTVAVKNNRINSYEYINYENDKRTAWRIIQKSKWGKCHSSHVRERNNTTYDQKTIQPHGSGHIFRHYLREKYRQHHPQRIFRT